MSTQGLTDDDIAKLQELAGNSGPRSLTATECRQAREQFKEGVSVRVLHEDLKCSRDLVRDHLAGRCDCENSVESLTQIRTGRQTKVECWVDGCEYRRGWFDKMTLHYREEHADGEVCDGC